MPLAGKGKNDTELEPEKAEDNIEETYQDTKNKELSGNFVNNYQKTGPTGLPIGTPETIITTHEDDTPAMMGVEVHPGPVTARLSCPLLLKRPMHAIPFFWK